MAHYGNGSSLSDLAREAESSRSDLAKTVDEIQSRVTPDALKRDAKDYARLTGQQFIRTIDAKARENPLAAVAIAAGLAIPLWRTVSSIPVPVLLIGAGLAMSRRSPADPGGRSAELRQPQQNAGLPGKPPEFATSGDGRKSDFIGDIRHEAGLMGSRVVDAVGEKIDTARELASDAAASISETTRDVSLQAADSLNRAGRSMTDTMKRHPLLVGGLAFAVGGLVASSLPVTRPENRLMGSTSDTMKNRARDIAEEGVEAVQSAASEVYEDVATQTREQGLTANTARAAVKSAADQVGNVIEKASAAVEGSRSTSPGVHPSRKHTIINPESDNV